MYYDNNVFLQMLCYEQASGKKNGVYLLVVTFLNSTSLELMISLYYFKTCSRSPTITMTTIQVVLVII